MTFIGNAQPQLMGAKQTQEELFITNFIVEPKEVEDIIKENFDAEPKEIEDIVMGILYGAVEAEGLENIEGCIKDTDKFFQNILMAIQDFELKSAVGMAAGINKIGDAIYDVSDDIALCEGVQADMDAFEKMLVIFISPRTFTYQLELDLQVNEVQIHKEITDSIY